MTAASFSEYRIPIADRRKSQDRWVKGHADVKDADGWRSMISESRNIESNSSLISCHNAL